MAEHIGNIIPLIMKAASIRKSITDKILALPDNKDISRQGSNAFTINSSNLDKGILSPEYYDYKYQYQLIAREFESVPIEDTIDWLHKLLVKKSIKVKGNIYKLNPEVIEYLKGVYYE